MDGPHTDGLLIDSPRENSYLQNCSGGGWDDDAESSGGGWADDAEYTERAVVEQEHNMDVDEQAAAVAVAPARDFCF